MRRAGQETAQPADSPGVEIHRTPKTDIGARCSSSRTGTKQAYRTTLGGPVRENRKTRCCSRFAEGLNADLGGRDRVGTCACVGRMGKRTIIRDDDPEGPLATSPRRAQRLRPRPIWAYLKPGRWEPDCRTGREAGSRGAEMVFNVCASGRSTKGQTLIIGGGRLPRPDSAARASGRAGGTDFAFGRQVHRPI